MLQTLYLYIEDGSTWEDVGIFLTLASALHHAAGRVVKYMSTQHPWGEAASFHIEVFRPKATNALHLKPTYECYRIRALDRDERLQLQHAWEAHGELIAFFQHSAV